MGEVLGRDESRSRREAQRVGCPAGGGGREGAAILHSMTREGLPGEGAWEEPVPQPLHSSIRSLIYAAYPGRRCHCRTYPGAQWGHLSSEGELKGSGGPGPLMREGDRIGRTGNLQSSAPANLLLGITDNCEKEKQKQGDCDSTWDFFPTINQVFSTSFQGPGRIVRRGPQTRLAGLSPPHGLPAGSLSSFLECREQAGTQDPEAQSSRKHPWIQRLRPRFEPLFHLWTAV